MKTRVVTLLFLLVFSDCYQVDKTQIQNLNGNEILVIGHGGGGFKSFINYLPMNTWESFKQAVEERKVDGVEMDVQLSLDNKLIIFHDDLLEKSTNCTGIVNTQTAKKLTECIYSSSFYRIAGMEFQVVALEKVMQHFSKAVNRPFLTLDLKLYPGTEDNEEYLLNFTTALSEMINKYNYLENTLIESTSLDMLTKLKSINPELKLFIYPGDFESGLIAAKELNLYGITIRSNLITKEQVQRAHHEGFRVTIWGTKSKKSNYEAILKNPDFIQTDDINNLTSFLN